MKRAKSLFCFIVCTYVCVCVCVYVYNFFHVFSVFYPSGITSRSAMLSPLFTLEEVSPRLNNRCALRYVAIIYAEEQSPSAHIYTYNEETRWAFSFRDRYTAAND